MRAVGRAFSAPVLALVHRQSQWRCEWRWSYGRFYSGGRLAAAGGLLHTWWSFAVVFCMTDGLLL